MFRSAILALTLVSTPALANGFYRAEPVTPPSEQRFIVRDTVWQCGDVGCASSGQSASRPAIVCASLVREVGALKSFSVEGHVFDEAELQSCNRRAR